MSKIHVNEISLEAATKAIYEDKGDRKGVMYIGWDQEPEDVKAQWRVDVRFSVEKYLAALPGTVAQYSPSCGEDDVDRIAKWLHNETAHPDSYPNHTWPETDRDDGQREGGFVKIVPQHAQAYFRDIARRLLTQIAVTAGPSLSSTESKPGFFANLTPEQQTSALEYDGPENHGDAALIPTLRCTCAAEVNTDIPHARFCALSSTNGDGAAK